MGPVIELIKCENRWDGCMAPAHTLTLNLSYNNVVWKYVEFDRPGERSPE